MGADTADTHTPTDSPMATLPVCTTAPYGVDTASAGMAACSRDTLSGTRVSPGQGDGVLRPGAVVGERHEPDPLTSRGVAAQAVGALQARGARRDGHPVALGPARDSRPEGRHGARRLMALCHHRQEGREGSVDQAQVRMADATERHLDQDLTRPGFGNRNIFDRNGFVSV